ncbi:NADPH-dependent F420 reductase [Streptomyces xiamenensis]
MIVTIVGAGSMARGIATRALVGGHSVRLIDHSADKARALADELRQAHPAGHVQPSDAIGVEDADIVVLAVPHPVGRDLVNDYGTALTGSVVVDICNPVDFTTFDSLVTAPGVSAAEEIAAEAAPGVPVVKAFNTTFAATLVAGEVAGQRLDVFLAGDDEGAKATVAELVSSGGLRPLDVGPLRRARELEGFQFLLMTVQDRLGFDWAGALKIIS